MRELLFVFAVSVLSEDAMSADSDVLESYPPDQCMNQCELAGSCEPMDFDEFPDFDATLSIIGSNCSAKYLYAVEGVCQDGRRMLRTGNGTTSEIRLYAAGGSFQGLITQTDAAVPPCMGQSYWPTYMHCESPTVVARICGIGFEVGSPAFQNWWNE